MPEKGRFHRLLRAVPPVDIRGDAKTEWDQINVVDQIDAISAAFESWKAIRDEPVAQAYLVSLIGKRTRSE